MKHKFELTFHGDNHDSWVRDVARNLLDEEESFSVQFDSKVTTTITVVREDRDFPVFVGPSISASGSGGVTWKVSEVPDGGRWIALEMLAAGKRLAQTVNELRDHSAEERDEATKPVLDSACYLIGGWIDRHDVDALLSYELPT